MICLNHNSVNDGSKQLAYTFRRGFFLSSPESGVLAMVFSVPGTGGEWWCISWLRLTWTGS